MKRGTKLLILMLCLSLVGLGAWGISVLTQKDPTPMDQGTLIFSLEGKQTLCWTYEENAITFHITDEGWVNPQIEGYQITPQAKKAITDELAKLYARKTIAQPEDLSAFGLTQPRCTIQADDITISIGNEVAIGNQLYVTLGDGKVHLVNNTLLTPFTKSLEDMVQPQDIPDLSAVRGVVITKADAVIELQKDITADQWFLDTADGFIPADQTIAAGLIAHLTTLDFLTCADCTPTDLSAYGLDHPTVYEITYDTKTYTLLLGSSTDAGVYAMPQGGSMVYRIDATAGNAMLAITAQELLPRN